MTKFETIRKHSINHALGVAKSFLKTSPNEVLGSDYFCIIKNEESSIKLLEDNGFGMEKIRYKNRMMGISKPLVIEITLQSSDIDWFDNNKDLYKLTLSTIDGKMYEEIKNPFNK